MADPALSISFTYAEYLALEEASNLELRRREPDGPWSASFAGPGQALSLTSVGVTLAVDDVYRDVFEGA